MALAVGDVLKRKSGGGSVRLVGVSGSGRWVAVDAERHGAPFEVGSADLVSEFRGVADPSPPQGLSEEDLRRADHAATDADARAYGRSPEAQREARTNERRFADRAARLAGRDPITPEERFAQEAEGGDDATP